MHISDFISTLGSVCTHIIGFVNAHPHSVYIIAFVIVFLETVVGLGIIIPSSIFMTAIGAMVGASVVSFYLVFLFAVAGATCGDYLGFSIGRYYRERLGHIWPFTRYPDLMSKGEAFVNKHGIKSVFLGRLLGPARSFVPAIVGAMGMSKKIFLYSTIPSAMIWVLAHLIPGMLFGYISMDLPGHVILKIAIIIVISISVIFLISLLGKFIYKYIITNINIFSEYLIDRSLFIKKICVGIGKQYKQVSRLILAIMFFILFIATAYIVRIGYISDVNTIVYSFMQLVHSDNINKFMLFCTMLGEYKFIFIVAIVFSIVAFFMKKRIESICLFASIISSMFLVEAFKKFFGYVRPPFGASHFHGGSFPSGHVCMSVSILGFIAIMSSVNLKNDTCKKTIYYSLGSIVFMVLLSRIYLGFHWSTDVIGSLLLSGCILCKIDFWYRFLLYRYRNFSSYYQSQIINRVLIISIMSIYILVLIPFFSIYMNKNIERYQLIENKNNMIEVIKKICK